MGWVWWGLASAPARGVPLVLLTGACPSQGLGERLGFGSGSGKRETEGESDRVGSGQVDVYAVRCGKGYESGPNHRRRTGFILRESAS